MGVDMTMWEWMREIFATIFFVILMGVVCAMLVLIFPDPTLWK